MIKVTIIALGKIKEKHFASACEEYIKRLKGYCSLEIVEIEPIRLSEKASQTEIEKALSKEAQLISSKIPVGSTVFAMCVEGKPLSSEAFAQKIKDCCDMGKSITFIIGSSYGLSKNVKSAADVKMSVSEMTFPHRLFRVMLLEQIYRGFKINEGSKYHK